MKVDKSKARRPDEEYEHYMDILFTLDLHLPWDLHPNQLRSQDMYRNKILKKIQKLLASEEGKEYTYF
jgi:hypothetical protein